VRDLGALASPSTGLGVDSRRRLARIYFFASLFSLAFVFLWGASLLDAVERPAPGTCAESTPDEGLRGYTNNFGLHKSRGTQNMFGATHFGGGE
jgi:hypothetical protein